MRKALLFLVAGVFSLCLFTAPALAAKADAGEVIVYNWSEYIPQDVLNDFTKETGIKVVYSTFETNEAMFAKVKLMQGKGYDIVVPSSYFVGMMRKDGLLEELDLSKIPNLSNIDPRNLNQAYDPGNKHTIPYMWGAVGLAYNSKRIPKGSITKWNDLLKPEFKGRVIMSDDLGDAFGLALKARGLSTETTSEDDIKSAYEFLKELKKSVRVFDVTAIKQSLISEEVWIGPIWNGDFLVAKEEKDDLEFVYPEEGAVLWVDSFVMLKNAPNKENAYTFINYMLRPEVAARCVEEYMYSTPNAKALDLLPEELRDNIVLNPGDEQLKNSEYSTGVGEALQTYEKYWEMLKTNQ